MPDRKSPKRLPTSANATAYAQGLVRAGPRGVSWGHVPSALCDPGPGEAVVVVQACGVCHTDLHYREGGINDEFPFLLGHEAAGVVEAVGPGSGTTTSTNSTGAPLARAITPLTVCGIPWPPGQHKADGT